MAQDLNGQVAFVTGGGSGIGAAVCRKLADAGARVAVADRNGAAANAIAAELTRAGHAALALELDVTDRDGCNRAIAACVARFGALHLGVNNAGIGAPRNDLAEVPDQVWDQLIAVNLTGVFNAMRAEIPALLAAGGGAIVNVSSICGLVAVAGSSAYTAAKHGVIGLTKAAALDYAARGIRVNAIAPGFIDTPLVSTRPGEARDALVGRHPIGRLGAAEEIADTILYLLGGQSSFITGAVIAADGGLTAQ